MDKLFWHCCCHFKHGCQDVFDAKGLEYHQKCCIYREINCVFDNCEKQILFKDFFDHIEICHQYLKNAIKTDGKTFIVSFDSSDRATIRFEVPNFTQLKQKVYSKAVLVQNLEWKIMISPNKEQLYKGTADEKFVGFFLNCNTKQTGLSCRAKAQLKVINHAQISIKRNFDSLFTIKNIDFGWTQFKEWTELTDPEKGFLKDDTVTFEVKLLAGQPTGNVVKGAFFSESEIRFSNLPKKIFQKTILRLKFEIPAHIHKQLTVRVPL